MTSPAPRRLLSVEEYLEFEESAPEPHEYVAGEVYAMTGSTRRHGIIVQNVSFALKSAARQSSCKVFTHGLKLRPTRDRIYYPDVMVLCTPGRDDDLVVDDPCVVVEVTSPTTGRTDRGEKADAYRQIPSLRAYLVIEQLRRRVLRHWREASGTWQLEEFLGEGRIAVPCPELALTLDEIYEGVELSAVNEPELAEYEA